MRNKTKSLVRRLGVLIAGVVLLAGQPAFCSCADESEAQAAAGQQTNQVTALGRQEDQQTQRETGPGIAPLQLNPEELSIPMVSYAVYQENLGWSDTKHDNEALKVPDESFVSAIRLCVTGQSEELTGNLTYRAYISGKGWQEWTENALDSGNPEEHLPVESVSAKFTKSMEEYYDIYYSIRQSGEWSEWAANGVPAGVEGSGVLITGLRAAMVIKGKPAPEIPPEVTPGVVDPNRPMVALTFDDGPSSAVTGRILNSLEANGGRATFFMVGNRVPGTQAVVQRMVSMECEVANHTYEHKYLTKIGDGGIRSQVGLTNQKIAEACGVTPTLVRPPGGYYNQASLNTLGSMGMAAVMWDIDTLDWKTRNAQNTINVVLNQVKDGDIVLMHDIYSTSADAAEVIIPELVKRGYQLVTVSELARYRGGITAGHVYNRFRP